MPQIIHGNIGITGWGLVGQTITNAQDIHIIFNKHNMNFYAKTVTVWNTGAEGDGNLYVLANCDENKWNNLESNSILIPPSGPVQMFVFSSDGAPPITSIYLSVRGGNNTTFNISAF